MATTDVYLTGNYAPVLDETTITDLPVTGSIPAELDGDRSNVCWLLVLYFMQGVPMGLSAAVPLILKERGASFSDIALFSVVCPRSRAVTTPSPPRAPHPAPHPAPRRPPRLQLRRHQGVS